MVCAEGHDEEVRQISLKNEWSADSWTADDSCGEMCAQLDHFNWFLPADDRVGDIPAPESQVDLLDIENDVDDVVRMLCGHGSGADDDDGGGVVVSSGGRSDET